MTAATESSIVVVPMPRLSDSMEEGLIVRWLVADGEAVERGQEVVEIETDKATMSFEAPVAGPLWTIAAEEASVAVGDPIARIGGGADDTAPDAGDSAPDAGDSAPD